MNQLELTNEQYKQKYLKYKKKYLDLKEELEGGSPTSWPNFIGFFFIYIIREYKVIDKQLLDNVFQFKKDNLLTNYKLNEVYDNNLYFLSSSEYSSFNLEIKLNKSRQPIVDLSQNNQSYDITSKNNIYLDKFELNKKILIECLKYYDIKEKNIPAEISNDNNKFITLKNIHQTKIHKKFKNHISLNKKLEKKTICDGVTEGFIDQETNIKC